MYEETQEINQDEELEIEREHSIPLKEELNKPLMLEYYRVIDTDDYNLALLTVSDRAQRGNIKPYVISSYSKVIRDQLKELDFDPNLPKLPTMVKFEEKQSKGRNPYHKMVYLK